MIEFSETALQIFRASSALERGDLRRKGGGKKTIHFNGSEQNVELILRTVTSANQLSIYGAVANICTEVSIPWPQGNQKHMIFERRWKFLPNLLLPTLGPMNSNGKTCCKNTSNNSNAQKLSKLCSNAGLKTVERRQCSSHLVQKDRPEWYICAENIRCLVTI